MGQSRGGIRPDHRRRLPRSRGRRDLQQRGGRRPDRAARRLPQGAPVGHGERGVRPRRRPAHVVDTEHGRIGVMICYDVEFPEWVRAVALSGADLLCAPVNWPLLPRPEGERPTEMVRALAGAGMNRMPIAVCDRAGVERGSDWIGGSVITDADGYPLAGRRVRHGRASSPPTSTSRSHGSSEFNAAQRRARRPPHRPLPPHPATRLTAARPSSHAPTRAPGCPALRSGAGSGAP